MFMIITDEASINIFRGFNSNYSGYLTDEIDAENWHEVANVINLVRIRPDLERFVSVTGNVGVFQLQHVEAVYHRNGLSVLAQQPAEPVKSKVKSRKIKSLFKGRKGGCGCSH
jgi:hypothetical protein